MPPANRGNPSSAINSPVPGAILANCLVPSRPFNVPLCPTSTALLTASITFLPLYPIWASLATRAAGAVIPPASNPAVAVAMATSVGSSGSTIKKSVRSLALSPDPSAVLSMVKKSDIVPSSPTIISFPA